MRWAGRMALWRTVFDVWAVFFFYSHELLDLSTWAYFMV